MVSHFVTPTIFKIFRYHKFNHKLPINTKKLPTADYPYFYQTQNLSLLDDVF